MRALCLALLFTVPLLSQTNTGDATTSGPCSPANTGDDNIFTINCGIGKDQGQRMLDIVNKILANQLDPNAVMAKLDEILKTVNPNLPTKTYFCNGQWRTVGPGPNIALNVVTGGDDSAFQEMASLNNSGEYPELLMKCLAHIKSEPEWLTPRLFCGLAYWATGEKAKASDMLAEFESKTGPAYDDRTCKQASDFLHGVLR